MPNKLCWVSECIASSVTAGIAGGKEADGEESDPGAAAASTHSLPILRGRDCLLVRSKQSSQEGMSKGARLGARMTAEVMDVVG